MRSLIILTTLMLALPGISVGAQGLPEPVVFGLQRLDQICRDGGGRLTFPEDISVGYLEADINGDAEPDYVIYQCEFSCDWRTNFATNGHACAFNSLVVSDWPWYSLVTMHGQPLHAVVREGEPDTQIGLRRHFDDTGPEAVCEGYFCWVAWRLDGFNLDVSHWAADEEALRAMLASE